MVLCDNIEMAASSLVMTILATCFTFIAVLSQEADIRDDAATDIAGQGQSIDELRKLLLDSMRLQDSMETRGIIERKGIEESETAPPVIATHSKIYISCL